MSRCTSLSIGNRSRSPEPSRQRETATERKIGCGIDAMSTPKPRKPEAKAKASERHGMGYLKDERCRCRIKRPAHKHTEQIPDIGSARAHCCGKTPDKINTVQKQLSSIAVVMSRGQGWLPFIQSIVHKASSPSPDALLANLLPREISSGDRTVHFRTHSSGTCVVSGLVGST